MKSAKEKRVLLLIFIFLCSAAFHVAAQRVYSQRSPEFNIRGDATVVGNRILNGAQSNKDNTETVMSNIDLDGDATTTTNSSNADLVLPVGSTVAWAGLYWAGRSSNFAARNRIKFKKSGSAYSVLTATQLDNGNTIAGITMENHYQGFIDVTTYVQTKGAGTYWAGDILTISGDGSADPYGTGYYGGWSLVVIYTDIIQPYRNITVHDGYSSVWNGNGTPNITVPITGFLTPASGSFTTKLGVVAWEGDLKINNDKFRLNVNDNAHNITDANNPSSNFFNSTMSNSPRNPNTVNNWGVDFDYMTSNISLPINSTSTNVYFNTSGDFYLTGALIFTVDINPVVLPVALTSFDVACNFSHQLEIKWSTASEINNDYFTIERSTDNHFFEEWKIIKGAGNSTTLINYFEIDEHPINGLSYYRLKQTDYNGNFTFNGTEAANKCEEEVNLSLTGLIVNQNSLLIKMTNKKEIVVALQIYNASGNRVFDRKISLQEGYNTINNYEMFSSGIYLIRILVDHSIYSKKITI